MKVWWVDVENTARSLAKKHQNVLVWSIDRGKGCFNPLVPSRNMPWERWIPKLCEAFGRAFFIKDAGQSLLRKTIYSLNEEKKQIPVLMDIQKYLEKEFIINQKSKSSREIEWASSIINRVDTVNAELGDVINSARSIPLEELASYHLVVELKGLSATVAAFFTEILITQLYYYQVYNNNPYSYVIIIDEAHNLIHAGDNPFDPEESSILDVLQLMGRKRNIYTIVASQLPSNLNQSSREAGVVMSFGLNTFQQSQSMFSSLLLNTDEQKNALLELPKRHFIYCNHSFPQPIRGYTLDIDLPEITDEELDSIMDPQLEQIARKLNSNVAKKEESSSLVKNQREDSTYVAILHHIRQFPWMALREISESMGVPASSVSAYCQRAEKAGLLAFKTIQLGKGPPSKLPVPTEKFIQVFGQPNLEGCKCGIVAYSWLKRIEQFYLKFLPEGYLIEKEFFITDKKSVDMALIRGEDKVLCVEIEMGRDISHSIANIEKALFVFGKIISACESQDIKERVEREAKKIFSEEQLSKIVFAALPEFLDYCAEFLP
jgi:hypothetical protein